jgi:pimeloyl-ACP methyl ester carboxylesterase
VSPLPPPFPGELVTTGGRRLFVRRSVGPGTEPAVFVHGLGGASTNWTDLMVALEDRLSGAALDLPGFGWSPPPDDGDFSPAGLARAVIGLIEAERRATGHRAVHLFGNSLGGAVVTRVAALRPDLVRTLTLVSPALPVYRPMRTNVHLPVAAVPLLGERLMSRLVRISPQNRVRVTLGLIFGDPSTVPPERVQEAVEELRRRTQLPYDSDALLCALRGLMAAYLVRGPNSLWRLAARVTAPTLLIYGARDKLVDPRTAQRAARTFRNARLVMLPTSGHVAMMEHPEVVAREVRHLLDTYADRRSALDRR